MKTARFAAVVKASGEPETHLLLVSPDKDKLLQAAIKTRRVMTVHQDAVGNKADHGKVGFEPGRARQFLVFPESVSKFDGLRIVGINYDLLKGRPSKEPAKRGEKAPRSTSEEEKSKPRNPPREKLVRFTKPRREDELDEENEAIRDIKNQVRHAMEVLEQGRQVAAFNLLKRIVGG
jgi:hypothetical protein